MQLVSDIQIRGTPYSLEVVALSLARRVHKPPSDGYSVSRHFLLLVAGSEREATIIC